MDLLNDLLKRKAKQIDLDEKRQELSLVAEELQRFFTKRQAKVIIVSDKTVTIQVSTSALASELRMSQVVVLESISRSLRRKISKLYIRVIN